MRDVGIFAESRQKELKREVYLKLGKTNCMLILSTRIRFLANDLSKIKGFLVLIGSILLGFHDFSIEELRHLFQRNYTEKSDNPTETFFCKSYKLSDPRCFTQKSCFGMLSENDRYVFENFQVSISKIDQLLSVDEIDRTNLKEELSALQNLFQTQIQLFESEDYRIRSVLIEIDKQMRLLKMDSMFLQTARQTETAQQRVGQVRDRLRLLQSYCTALLGSDPD